MNDEMNRAQYFDLPEFIECQKEEEIFVDGGAYDGATTLRFREWCGSKFKKAYLFEPDEANFVNCRRNLEAKMPSQEMDMFQMGLSNKKELLSFESHADSSRVSQTGDQTVKVDALDHLITDDVTFLKLDVEGAECQALIGAEQLIKRCKPKLAVCLYHKPEDIWEIPMLILKFNPDYKFYIRHYTMLQYETILYAM